MVEHNQSQYYGNQYKFNGKELDAATGMYYYGARYYDPRLSIFISVDPLAEQTFEPYSYTGNNPIMFTDPTGMSKDGVETELFNLKGDKIGEDANGIDGNVSIIVDEKKAKSIEKNHKKGGVASQEDVDSGIKTTKTVISEAINVIERTEKNGGNIEETSVIDPLGNITRGNVETTTINVLDNKISISAMPNVEGSNNTGIHSHVPLYPYVDEKGNIMYSSANQPGPADFKTFEKYSLNIIVGRLGNQEGTIDFQGKTQLSKAPPLGASFYSRGAITRSGSLTIEAMKKIIK